MSRHVRHNNIKCHVWHTVLRRGFGFGGSWSSITPRCSTAQCTVYRCTLRMTTIVHYEYMTLAKKTSVLREAML